MFTNGCFSASFPIWSRILSFVSLFWMVQISKARAEYPPSVHMSEMQPPTEEEWIELQIRRSIRRNGVCCMPRVRLQPQIWYYPFECGCAPEVPATFPLDGNATIVIQESVPASPGHRSYRGTYGIRHPMPYYIPAVRVGVAEPKEPCDRRLPIPQIRQNPNPGILIDLNSPPISSSR